MEIYYIAQGTLLNVLWWQRGKIFVYKADSLYTAETNTTLWGNWTPITETNTTLWGNWTPKQDF